LTYKDCGEWGVGTEIFYCSSKLFNIRNSKKSIYNTLLFQLKMGVPTPHSPSYLEVINKDCGEWGLGTEIFYCSSKLFNIRNSKKSIYNTLLFQSKTGVPTPHSPSYLEVYILKNI